MLTPSHPLRVTVLQDGVFQNIGNPTVKHLFGTIYYVFLSNANLPVNSATNPYQLQVSTDLIPVPLTQNFVGAEFLLLLGTQPIYKRPAGSNWTRLV